MNILRKHLVAHTSRDSSVEEQPVQHHFSDYWIPLLYNMYLHASNDAIIIILIVCSFTSSYVSMGITIAHYIVYYQIIVTQPSRGTWNSVYKLQHTVHGTSHLVAESWNVLCGCLNSSTIWQNMFTCRPQHHTRISLGTLPWLLPLTSTADYALSAKKNIIRCLYCKQMETHRGKVLHLRATDSHVDLLNAATSCFRAKYLNLTKAFFFPSTGLFSAWSW